MCNQMWGMARTDTVIRVLLTWESIHLSYTHEFNPVQHSFHSLNHVQATHQSTNPTVVLSFIGPVSPFSQFAIQSVHLPIYPSTNLILHPPRPPLFNQFISSQYSCPQISYCVQTLISSAICPAHQFIHPPSASAQSRNLITSLLILSHSVDSFLPRILPLTHPFKQPSNPSTRPLSNRPPYYSSTQPHSPIPAPTYLIRSFSILPINPSN